MICINTSNLLLSVYLLSIYITLASIFVYEWMEIYLKIGIISIYIYGFDISMSIEQKYMNDNEKTFNQNVKNS